MSNENILKNYNQDSNDEEYFKENSQKKIEYEKKSDKKQNNKIHENSEEILEIKNRKINEYENKIVMLATEIEHMIGILKKNQDEFNNFKSSFLYF